MEPSRAGNQSFQGFILLVALLALAAGAKAILYDSLDPDLFWHLRVADALSRQHFPSPLVDDLSFASMKTPWTPYSWLAELAMKRLWDWGGYRAAVAATAIMSAGFVALLALIALELSIERTGGPRYLASALAAFAGGFLSLPYLSFRPVTAALVLLAACVWLLVRDRRVEESRPASGAAKRRRTGSRAVWLVIPLTILLINVHLYAIFVPLAVAAFAFNSNRNPLSPSPGTPGEGRGEGLSCRVRTADQSVRWSAMRTLHAKSLFATRQAILLLGTLIACLLTPMLPGVVRAAWHYQFTDIMVSGHVIAEMQPFYHGQLGYAAAAVALTILIAAIINRRAIPTANWIWLAGGTILLLRLGRFAPVFAIFSAPTLAVTLPALSDNALGRRPLWIIMATTLCLGIVRVAAAFPSASQSMSDWINRTEPDDGGYPTGAADFVQTHIPARTHHILTEFTWGGYLEWRLGAGWQVLLDGRTQLFSADFWRTLYLSDASQRKAYLAILPADAAVVPAKNSRFRASLLDLGWKTVYADQRAEVLTPPPAGAITTVTSTPRSGRCIAGPDSVSSGIP